MAAESQNSLSFVCVRMGGGQGRELGDLEINFTAIV